MSEIAFVAKLTAAEGKRDEALEVLRRLVAATEDEPGTMAYVLMSDTTDPAVIWFHELYADQAAFEAHAGSAAMAEVVGALGGLLDGPADLRQATVVARKGAAAP